MRFLVAPRGRRNLGRSQHSAPQCFARIFLWIIYPKKELLLPPSCGLGRGCAVFGSCTGDSTATELSTTHNEKIR